MLLRAPMYRVPGRHSMPSCGHVHVREVSVCTTDHQIFVNSPRRFCRRMAELHKAQNSSTAQHCEEFHHVLWCIQWFALCMVTLHAQTVGRTANPAWVVHPCSTEQGSRPGYSVRALQPWLLPQRCPSAACLLLALIRFTALTERSTVAPHTRAV